MIPPCQSGRARKRCYTGWVRLGHSSKGLTKATRFDEAWRATKYKKRQDKQRRECGKRRLSLKNYPLVKVSHFLQGGSVGFYRKIYKGETAPARGQRYRSVSLSLSYCKGV